MSELGLDFALGEMADTIRDTTVVSLPTDRLAAGSTRGLVSKGAVA